LQQQQKYIAFAKTTISFTKARIKSRTTSCDS